MPQFPKLQDLGSTPAALLATRCEAQATEPWLFFRRDWKWRWASYGQVADQVARGLRVLRQTATSAPGETLWGTHGTQHPDAVAVACMLLEVGGTLRLRRPAADGSLPLSAENRGDGERWVHATDTAVDTESFSGAPESGPITVPTVAGQLDRRPLEVLDPASLGKDVVSVVEDENKRWNLSDLRARAQRLAQALAAGHRPQEGGSWLHRWRARRRLPPRPVICVNPAMSPVDQLVVAWASLALDAAWILEPHIDAFLPTVDWVRPTVVVTDPEHEEELHRRLVALPRSHRRLRSVVTWPPSTSSSLDPQLWHELEIGRSQFP